LVARQHGLAARQHGLAARQHGLAVLLFAVFRGTKFKSFLVYGMWARFPDNSNAFWSPSFCF
jgi:hypothetical protein